MHRSTLLLIALLLLLSACTAQPTAQSLPAQVPGGWKLQEQKEEGIAKAPDRLKRAGLAKQYRVRYQGPIDITVQVSVMKSATGAFEARQIWYPVAGEAPMQKGLLFLVASSEHPNKELLKDFVLALDRLL
jgi:hypothetical protein